MYSKSFESVNYCTDKTLSFLVQGKPGGLSNTKVGNRIDFTESFSCLKSLMGIFFLQLLCPVLPGPQSYHGSEIKHAVAILVLPYFTFQRLSVFQNSSNPKPVAFGKTDDTHEKKENDVCQIHRQQTNLYLKHITILWSLKVVNLLITCLKLLLKCSRNLT